jgi:aminoglycoside phosphotransferase (APT) family kinase protein
LRIGPILMVDIEQPPALIAYLRATGRIAPDETPQVRALSGGVSNRTVLVERASGEAWVLKQALEKLRVPVDWFSSPERIHREAAGLRWLARLAPPGSLPAFAFEDHDQHILAMAAVAQPHANWKQMLLAGQLDLAHVDQFARILGQIHREAYARRAEVSAEFADRSFFESLRLEPYYSYTASQAPGAVAFLHALIDETRATRITLTHGDYSPKNILIHDNRLVLLDHEVIHFGDPAFDLGFSLTHLLSKAHHLPALRQDFAGAALRYWQGYREIVADQGWLDGLEPRAARHTLGCLLARVAGRSPLEYMGAAERERQRAVVVALMSDPPATVSDLANRFIAGISSHAHD